MQLARSERADTESLTNQRLSFVTPSPLCESDGSSEAGDELLNRRGELNGTGRAT
jgi:hypothetical protein